MELRGKRQICQHVKRSWETIVALKEKQKFPVTFLAGTWVSDTDEIKEWRIKKLRRRG